MAKLANIANRKLCLVNRLMINILILLLVAFNINAQLEETNYNRREHSLTTPFLGSPQTNLLKDYSLITNIF